LVDTINVSQFVDDISVTTFVPEPASTLLCGAAIAIAAIFNRRRRRAVRRKT
jgi:PEP-CTERM motif-containing protein